MTRVSAICLPLERAEDRLTSEVAQLSRHLYRLEAALRLIDGAGAQALRASIAQTRDDLLAANAELHAALRVAEGARQVGEGLPWPV